MYPLEHFLDERFSLVVCHHRMGPQRPQVGQQSSRPLQIGKLSQGGARLHGPDLPLKQPLLFSVVAVTDIPPKMLLPQVAQRSLQAIFVLTTVYNLRSPTQGPQYRYLSVLVQCNVGQYSFLELTHQVFHPYGVGSQVTEGALVVKTPDHLT
jgi:hypothetical protein